MDLSYTRVSPVGCCVFTPTCTILFDYLRGNCYKSWRIVDACQQVAITTYRGIVAHELLIFTALKLVLVIIGRLMLELIL